MLLSRWLCYFLIYFLVLPFFIHLWLRGRKDRRYRQHWLERLGFFRADPKWQNGLVVHCASVGETLAAAPMIHALLKQYPDLPLTITSITPTGVERVKASFGEQVRSLYLPIDTPLVVQRFLNRCRPKAILILETELWPNLIDIAANRSIPVVIANARMSERSASRYQKMQFLARNMFAKIALVAAHGEEDAKRFISLGMSPDKVQVTGSIKFDVQIDQAKREQAELLRTCIGKDRPVWIAGSTHPGEDEQLIAVHRQLLQTQPQACLILVPRHQERFNEVAEIIKQHQLSGVRRSEMHDTPQLPDCQVLLGDTMGELGMMYGAADIAFIGGSLVERGGHNPLEAAAFNIPVLTGEHIFNFAHIYPMLFAVGGGEAVTDTTQLLARLNIYFSEPETRQLAGQQARAVVEQNKGALAKLLSAIAHQLSDSANA